MNDLLIEIGCEELPPKTLMASSQAFGRNFVTLLQQARLSHGQLQIFATPRRLGFLCRDVASRQADQVIDRRGPPVKVAFADDGAPLAAALHFAKSCGVSLDAIGRQKTVKGEWLFYQQAITGRTLVELMPELLVQAVQQIPIKRAMRWGTSDDTFIRPVHWLVVLYGDQVIPAQIFGCVSDRLSYGHRFHHPQALSLTRAEEYEQTLEHQGQVIADFSKRQQLIEQGVLQIATSKQANLTKEDGLLQEVAAMVEWPVPLCCQFEERFLQVPKEVLVSAIREHQRCFHLLDDEQQLLPEFIAVSNIASLAPEQVIHGNERVMRARLADAAFFYHQDCQQDLGIWYDKLDKVVFQKQLGSMQDKAKRMEQVGVYLAALLNVDPHQVARATKLAKVDLLSAMVGEFPELQGIMGAYYATGAGESKAVAQSLREHYLPRFAADELPESQLGKILALADRIDTLLGIFSIGQRPTGDKDPYALRRAAIAVLRIIIESKISCELSQVLAFAVKTFELPTDVVDEVRQFILDRLKIWYKEQGARDDHLQAVLACQCDDLHDVAQRLQALQGFLSSEEALSLAEANKRVRNLLSKDTSHDKAHGFSMALAHEASEQALAQALRDVQVAVKPLLAQKKYHEVLTQLAQLQKPTDAFFEAVMVLDPDLKLRQNRLALLAELRALFLQVADFSLLNIAS